MTKRGIKALALKRRPPGYEILVSEDGTMLQVRIRAGTKRLVLDLGYAEASRLTDDLQKAVAAMKAQTRMN